MIDHFGIKVKNLEISKAFYQVALAPLNYQIQFDNEWAASFAEETQIRQVIFGKMLVNKSLSILPLVPRMKRKWKPSIKQLWQPVARTMVLQVSAVSII